MTRPPTPKHPLTHVTRGAMNPPTERIPAGDVTPGRRWISVEGPAVVVRVAIGNRVRLHCRFIWDPDETVTWPSPEFHPGQLVTVAREFD